MPGVASGPADLRDIFVEALNAKDPDLLTLAPDIEVPDEVVDRVLAVMERWPRLMVGRAEIEDQPVAAIWVPDEDDRYTVVGHMVFDLEDGVARLDIVDEGHPDMITEWPPGFEVVQWESADTTGEGQAQ